MKMRRNEEESSGGAVPKTLSNKKQCRVDQPQNVSISDSGAAGLGEPFCTAWQTQE